MAVHLTIEKIRENHYNKGSFKRLYRHFFGEYFFGYYDGILKKDCGVYFNIPMICRTNIFYRYKI